MRLYTTPAGKWAGTQADAKKLGDFCEAEVPTMKADLLAFLNDHQVVFGVYTALDCGTPLEPTEPAKPIEPAKPRPMKGGSWDEYNAIRNHLETCDAKALNTALTIITGRLGDLLEKAS